LGHADSDRQKGPCGRGGIAGLTSAIALRRIGWDVQVLGQADEFGEAGAAILLWANALRAIDALGLGDQVGGELVCRHGVGVLDKHGR
jgi:2-polyprenyl-6-methoxyphenol hydroxylase-like FAD-dependent oxidoreductase